MLVPMRMTTTFRCPHVLVRHADGTDECEGSTRCGGDELLHDWELACGELACGCVGEEHDLVVGFPVAAAA
jgi:hypothetical protein